jgi:hypothetical protein
MKLAPNAAANNATKKPYSKPELQVYGNLAEITNLSTNRNGTKTDKNAAGTRTH